MISPYVYPLIKRYALPQKSIYRKMYNKFAKEDLVKVIIDEFNAPADFLDIRSRKRIHSEPRKIYCKISVCEMGKTKVAVGKEISGYDHSVVIQACQSFDSLYEVDETFRRKSKSVFHKLGITKIL